MKKRCEAVTNEILKNPSATIADIAKELEISKQKVEQPEEKIARKCRKCGKPFTFLSTEKRWPKNCPECRKNRRLLDPWA